MKKLLITTSGAQLALKSSITLGDISCFYSRMPKFLTFYSYFNYSPREVSELKSIFKKDL